MSGQPRPKKNARPRKAAEDEPLAIPLEAEARFLCQYCGEENVALVDATAGWRQEFEVDCSACCNPNHLRVRLDEDGGVEAEAERGHG